METKKFYLTSEFWITVGAVVTALSGALAGVSAHTGAILAVVATAAYALSRGFAKAGTPPLVTPEVIAPDEGDAGKP